MSRTLAEIEADLDRIVPNLAAACEASRRFLRALGGEANMQYEDLTPHLALDYDSSEEKEEESTQIKHSNNSSRGAEMPEWKKKDVEKTHKNMEKERKRNKELEKVANRKRKVKESEENADPGVIHPISRDTMPELLGILEDIVDEDCRLHTRDFIQYLYTEKLQNKIQKRIVKDGIVVISQDQPAAMVFIAKFFEVLEHSTTSLFKEKRLPLPKLTNRDKIAILRKMYLSSQIVDKQDVAPLKVKSTTLCKVTREYVKEKYPDFDLSTYERRLKSTVGEW